ncbi:MAG: zinc ABC transporter solute-binding protein [Actinobacteria bacterium]|nr:zinc ABC transporter solute-binding protein [Actinomycetota bacterium]
MPRPEAASSSPIRSRAPWLAVAVATALIMAAPAGARAATPRVVATVGMIGDVASELAGSCAQVSTLMGPGSDPHLYRASAGDVRLMERADLVLYGGLHLEASLARVLEGFASRTATVAVSEVAVSPAERIAAGSVYDPHVWMDVSLWHAAAGVIAEALAAAIVDAGDEDSCTEAIAARHADYSALLLDLHDWAVAAVASVPERQRILVTAHDAFAYFGRAYGIKVEGIQGISTETEAAVADIRRVAALMFDRGIPALFVESTINPRTVNAVLEAVEQRGGHASIGSELYADALGAEGEPEGTYVGMILHNVRAITTALGGRVPELPASVATWEARW